MGAIIDKTKGRIMQAVGDLTNDRELKREGRTEELKGKVEGKVDDIKNAAKKITNAVKDVVK